MLRSFKNSRRRGSPAGVRRSLLRPGRRRLVLEWLEPRRMLATVYVDLDAGGAGDGSSWDDAYTDLRVALTAATPGDEVWVAEGTYTASSTGDRTVSFNLKSGVDVYGGFDGSETALEERDWTTHLTVLSGDLNGDDATGGDTSENSYHVVYASGVTDATLDGFTITAGNATAYPSQDRLGGGMYNDASSAMLTNLIFLSNSARYGGGMYNDWSSSPTLTNVTFSGNSADYGGGMYNSSSSPRLTNVAFSGNYSNGLGGGMLNAVSSPTLTNVTFSGNSAGRLGGGMVNVLASPTLANVTFTKNSAGHEGGGMVNSASFPTLTNVAFSGNSAHDGGGGLYNTNVSSPTLTNVTFSGNSADDGGGMYNVDFSSPTLTNVAFSGNSADRHGGGMYNSSSSPTLTNVVFSNNSAIGGGGMYNGHGSPTLTNVAFSGNSANYGGGMCNYYNSSPTLTNCILWGNTASRGSEIYDDVGSDTTVAYSIVEGGWAGEGNLDLAPLFVDAPGGDLRLQSGSPAIDAGSNAAVPDDVADLDGDGVTDEPTPLDLDMLPRFVAASVDMGAYEYPNAPPVADDQSVTAKEDTPEAIALTATDPDGDELTFIIVSHPSHGTLSDFDEVTGTVVYIPDPDYHGDDSFTFKANDGSDDSNVATVSLTVLSAQEQIELIIAEVYRWVDEGFLNAGQGNALVSKLDAAIAQLDAGKIAPAVNELEAFENQIRALVRSGRLSAEEAEPVLGLTEAAIHSALTEAPEATDAAIAELNDGEPLDDLLDACLLDDLVSVGSSKPGKGRKSYAGGALAD